MSAQELNASNSPEKESEMNSDKELWKSMQNKRKARELAKKQKMENESNLDISLPNAANSQTMSDHDLLTPIVNQKDLQKYNKKMMHFESDSDVLRHIEKNKSLVNELNQETTTTDNTFIVDASNTNMARDSIQVRLSMTLARESTNDESMNLSISNIIDTIPTNGQTSSNSNEHKLPVSENPNSDGLTSSNLSSHDWGIGNGNNNILRVDTNQLMTMPVDPHALSPIKKKKISSIPEPKTSRHLSSQIKDEDEFKSFDKLHINDVHRDTNGFAIINNFFEMKHVDVIHSQGLLPPVCVAHENKIKERLHYKMIIPDIADNQTSNVICCRKKRKKNKYRFSTDENNMQKKRNKNYVGKMKIINMSSNHLEYLVTLKNYMKIMQIKIELINNVHCIEVKLLNKSYGNIQETDNDGMIMNGVIQSYMQPELRLRLGSTEKDTQRIVLELRNYIDLNTNKSSCIIDFDYPLTLFSSFAIICAVKTHGKYLKSNNLFKNQN